MAKITWKGGSGSAFNTAANWTPATVPGSADSVLITKANASVISSTGNTISTLAMGATDTLEIAAGLFAITNETTAQALAGHLIVDDAAALSLGGAIVNSGTINENSTGSTTQIIFSQLTNTLSGGGKINLSNSTGNFMFGAVASNLLDNVDNTISGGGALGAGQMALVNEHLGTIDATQATPLTVNTGGSTITNRGLMEATGGGNLTIVNAVNNIGGAITAGAGAVVVLESTVTGGTLASGSGASFTLVGGGVVLDGAGLHPLTSSALIQVADNQPLYLVGSITNNGSIALTSVGNNTDLRIASPLVTLQGTGDINLSPNFNNRIYATSGGYRLDNQTNTIDGAGQIGANTQLLFSNESLVDANQASPLQFSIPGSFPVTNTGTMQASGTGGLQFNTTVINNATGTIQALVAGAHVDFFGGALQGGTLKTGAGGVIQSLGGIVTLDGQTFGTLNNQGVFLVNDSTGLTVLGTINNTGTVNLSSAGNNTDIRIGSQTVTLSGNGKLVLSDNPANRIYTNNASGQLVNAGNVISGGGQIGVGSQLSLVNKGLINATGTSALTISTATSALTTNTGIMEATSRVAGNGGLIIASTVNNAGGTIRALGANAHVNLSGAYIEGGTLTTTLGGVIETAGGSGGALDGITSGTLANQGTVVVSDNTPLYLFGTINNTGTINQSSAGNNTDIRINSQTVTLAGTGKLVMSDNPANRIYANIAAAQLVNAGNTISGAGQLGTGSQLAVVNKGLIDANGAAALILNTGAALTTNAGTMEATSTAGPSGGLTIGSTVNNAGGTIQAVGATAHVDLGGGYIEGGILTTSSGGVIDTVGGGSALDGVTSGIINNQGSIQVNDNTSLTLFGTINNTGTINQISGGNFTDVHLGGQTVTLTGTGQWIMSDNPNNRIYGNVAPFTLINQGNTISGAGQIGAGQTQLINRSGAIIAIGSNALLINLAGTGINAAGAAMTANGAGGLVFSSGIFTNNGIMTANNGSAITFQGSTAVTNLAEGDLVGGQWKAISTGSGATLSMTGGPIITDAAILQVQGANSVIQGGNGSSFTPIEQTLTTITANGQLRVLGNRDYPGTQALDVSGTLQLGGGTLTAPSLTLESTGLLLGLGTVNTTVTDLGHVEAKGGVLTLAGNLTGGGPVQADAGSTLSLNGTSSTAGTVLDSGTVTLGTGANLTVTGNFAGTGAATVAAGAKLVLNGATNTVGLVLDNGTIALGGGTFTATSVTVAAGAQFVATGTVAETGAIANSGRVEVNAAKTLTLNGAVTGGGTLQADTGATLSLVAANNSAGIVLDNGTIAVTGTVDVTGSINPASTGFFILSPGALLDLAADTGANNKISFIASGDNGRLAIDTAAKFGTHVGLSTYAGPLLENFGVSAAIDLKDIVFPGATLDSYTGATGLLQLHSGATLATLKFDNATLHNAGVGLAGFHLGNDGSGHALLTHT